MLFFCVILSVKTFQNRLFTVVPNDVTSFVILRNQKAVLIVAFLKSSGLCDGKKMQSEERLAAILLPGDGKRHLKIFLDKAIAYYIIDSIYNIH
jgi:hypothetical protein